MGALENILMYPTVSAVVLAGRNLELSIHSMRKIWLLMIDYLFNRNHKNYPSPLNAEVHPSDRKAFPFQTDKSCGHRTNTNHERNNEMKQLTSKFEWMSVIISCPPSSQLVAKCSYCSSSIHFYISQGLTTCKIVNRFSSAKNKIFREPIYFFTTPGHNLF